MLRSLVFARKILKISTKIRNEKGGEGYYKLKLVKNKTYYAYIVNPEITIDNIVNHILKDVNEVRIKAGCKTIYKIVLCINPKGV